MLYPIFDFFLFSYILAMSPLLGLATYELLGKVHFCGSSLSSIWPAFLPTFMYYV